jgi:hypothetical protein
VGGGPTQTKRAREGSPQPPGGTEPQSKGPDADSSLSGTFWAPGGDPTLKGAGESLQLLHMSFQGRPPSQEPPGTLYRVCGTTQGLMLLGRCSTT